MIRIQTALVELSTPINIQHQTGIVLIGLLTLKEEGAERMGSKCSGVYQFTFPYLPNLRQQKEAGFHEMKQVTAEIHVGREEDVLEGKWITLIAYSTSSFSDYVETIFTNIRTSFLPNILDLLPNGRIVDDDSIRLVEVHTKSQDIYDWHELEMSWDERQHHYTHPIWKAISPDAWYYQSYQSKIHSYAQTGLNYLIHPQSVTLQTPLWLIKILQSAKRWLQKEHIEADPMALVTNSFRRLAKHKGHLYTYSSEITSLVIEEINQLHWSDNKEKYSMIEETQRLYRLKNPSHIV